MKLYVKLILLTLIIAIIAISTSTFLISKYTDTSLGGEYYSDVNGSIYHKYVESGIGPMMPIPYHVVHKNYLHIEDKNTFEVISEGKAQDNTYVYSENHVKALRNENETFVSTLRVNMSRGYSIHNDNLFYSPCCFTFKTYRFVSKIEESNIR